MATWSIDASKLMVTLLQLMFLCAYVMFKHSILPTLGLETPHIMCIVAVLKLAGSPHYAMPHIQVLFEKKRRKKNSERKCRTGAGEF